MANATPTRLGQNLATGDANALFLKIFSGEVLSAFGRAISEVGAVMIVGGNIDHYTRVMTTAISLETRMGNLEYAMALGLVLISITIIIYSLVYLLNNRSIK